MTTTALLRPSILFFATVLAAVAMAENPDPFDIVFPRAEMEDASTLEVERTGEQIIESEVRPGTRLRTIGLRFRSFSWAGEDWVHDATLVLPADGVPERALGTGVVVAGIRPYADAAVSILGVPALLITSGNPGPHYGEPKEGELMGQSLERMISTGDPRWNGYAWLGKVIVRGVTVMASLPETETRRAVVTGCSKRGMAAWIAAAADDRIAGAYPTCWNTGNYRETAKLLVDRYGGGYQRGRPDTRAPAFVSAQAQYERTLHPEFEKFSALTDPVLWGDRLADKEILYAFGTNDPLYHVLSCNLVVPKLAREPRVTLVPNTDHTPNTSQHITAWTMWVAHTLLGRDVPELEVHAETVDDRVTVDVEISGNTRLEKVELWWAEDPQGGYREATWKSKAMTNEEGVYRATLDRPTGSHLVFFVAVHDDDPATCPGYITSRPVEVSPQH